MDRGPNLINPEMNVLLNEVMSIVEHIPPPKALVCTAKVSMQDYKWFQWTGVRFREPCTNTARKLPLEAFTHPPN